MNAAVRKRFLWMLAGLVFVTRAAAQQLVVSTANDYGLGGPRPLLVIGDLAHAGSMPAFVPAFIVEPAPHALNPHGLALLDRDHAIAGHAGKPWVDLIDLAAGRLDTFFVPAAGDYEGHGSVAPNPAGTHLLLAPGSTSATSGHRSTLWVVPMPLGSPSVASHAVTLPGTFGTAQTRAITFDTLTGRAYVAHSAGISALDPPYTQASLAFTLALPGPAPDPLGARGRSLAMAPDRGVLLSATTTEGEPLVVVRAPFSSTSSVETLGLPGMRALDTIAFVPDGSRALVVDARSASDPWLARTQMFAIAAPFDAGADVQRLLFLDAHEANGYEDVVVSPDGRFAVLSGGGINADEDLRIVQAPFTASAIRSRRFAVPALALPFVHYGRGAGMAAFWPTPAPTLAQVSIDPSSITEGNAGTRSMGFVVRLGNPASEAVEVDYTTSNASASAGIDYVAAAGSVQFAPGQRERRIDITILSNTAAQADRVFRVVLSNPRGAQVLGVTSRDGEGLIVDDDDASRPVIVTDPPLADAVVGAPYASPPFTTIHLSTTEPPQPRWALPDAADNPPGVSISMADGVLTGVPQRAGRYRFRIQVSGDFPQQAVREYGLIVREERIFADGFDGTH